MSSFFMKMMQKPFFIPVIDLSRFSSIVYLQLSDVARLLLLLQMGLRVLVLV